jgi:hypothetical protein
MHQLFVRYHGVDEVFGSPKSELTNGFVDKLLIAF